MNDTLAEPVAGSLAGGADALPAFDALYRRTFPRVYAYVASLLGDRAAAEDVTSQAFERGLRKRRSFKASKGTPEAWIFGIARNAALDELRKRKRRADLESEPADQSLPEPDELADFGLRRATVRAALGQLDRREVDIVALKFAGGLTNAEIARVLGISESNAGTKLHRTIEKLREACHDAL